MRKINDDGSCNSNRNSDSHGNGDGMGILSSSVPMTVGAGARR